MRHPLLIRLVLLAVALGFAWLALTGWLALHMAQYSKNQIGADLQKRRDYLEAALRLNPQEGTAWLNLAELCFAERARAASEGDKDKARALMLEAEIAADHAIDTYPLFQAHRMRAWANYFQTEADAVNRFKALEAFDDALAIYPQDSQLIAQAARVALWNHEPERARRYLELSDQYKIDPHDPRAQNVDILLLRAELARVDGDKSSERRLAEEALQIDPRSGSALLRLARLLMEDAVETDQATGGNLIGSPTGLSFNRLRLLVEAAERKEDLSDAISIVERLLEERARMPSRVAAYDQLLNDVFGKIVNTAMRRNDPYAKLQVIDFALPFLQTMGRERMDGAIRSLASGVVGQVVRTFDGKLLADYLVLLLRHRGDPASSSIIFTEASAARSSHSAAEIYPTSRS
jgi:tetratricopeptide (TPR) repeat protein